MPWGWIRSATAGFFRAEAAAESVCSSPCQVDTFGGGTSFVAPQLNGVTALLAQNAGHRLGLLNVALYNLARFGLAQGRHPVINTISAGDNWFYKARDGYSPAVGLGTIDVFNLSEVTRTY
jgi:kumamolisin